MSATTKSLRCLIVEDVEDDALLMLHQLRTGGYDPTWERVDTPEAMRAALERQPWDVVLSDYRMPRFSGLAALELLRASGLDLPFIIVSGAIGEEIAVAAMKAGVDDYLVKGRLAHLTVAVEREMRNAVMRRKHREAKAEVQKSEARLAIALEASQSGVWDLDLLDNTAYHTLTHDRIFGYEAMQPGWSRDKFLGQFLPGGLPNGGADSPRGGCVEVRPEH